jgi:hypothetical protein
MMAPEPWAPDRLAEELPTPKALEKRSISFLSTTNEKNTEPFNHSIH